jgi:hypothetical protein
MKTLTVVLSLSAITLGTSLALAHGGGRGMMMNNDGKVTLAEAQQKAKERFAKLDANKDGSVTREEFKAGRQGGKRGDCKDK